MRGDLVKTASSDRRLTMRMPKCVRWSHRQTVLLLLESSDTLQPSPFQPPAPPGGSTGELLHIHERVANSDTRPQMTSVSCRSNSPFMLKSQNIQTGLRAGCQDRDTDQNHMSHMVCHQPPHACTHTYLLRQVSDLDLHRLHQVTDREVPDAARHHVAIEGSPVLLFLKTEPAHTQHRSARPHTCAPMQLGLTWNRLVLLKNMKLILDRDEWLASRREALDSRDGGRMT